MRQSFLLAAQLPRSPPDHFQVANSLNLGADQMQALPEHVELGSKDHRQVAASREVLEAPVWERDKRANNLHRNGPVDTRILLVGHGRNQAARDFRLRFIQGMSRDLM